LRSDDVTDADAPPGLARIDELADAAREAGREVSVDVTSAPLPASVDAAAFRIIQESLTNVLRHADAMRIAVTATMTNAELAIRVADDGSGAAPIREGAGIRGMRERANLLGGRLTAAAGDAGFAVEARIPLAENDEP